METLLYLFVGGVAFVLLLAIAEPYRFFPEAKEKKRFVGSTYWGAYEGTSIEQPSESKTIEIRKAARKEVYIAGSGTYAKGRGVKMSGRG